MRNYFQFIPEYDHRVGDTSEFIFFALVKAHRLNKKVRLGKKRIWIPFANRKYQNHRMFALFDISSKMIEDNDNFSFYDYISGFKYSLCFFIKLLLAKLLKKRYGSQCKYFDSSVGSKDLYNVFQDEEFSFENVRKADWSRYYNLNMEIGLKKQHYDRCAENALRLGIPENKKIITLHLRTSQYYDGFKGAGESNFRNASIDNYYPAIEYLLSLGYTVVRLGDKIPEERKYENYIDYVNSIYKCLHMDMYFLQRSYMYIGMHSGIFDTANLFYAPKVITNITSYLPLVYREMDMLVYKHLYCRKTGREVSLDEIVSNISFFEEKRFHDQYFFEENTPGEILDSVKEQLERISNYSFKKTALQKAYADKAGEAFFEYIEKKNEAVDAKYHKATYASGDACVANFWLERYFNVNIHY